MGGGVLEVVFEADARLDEGREADPLAVEGEAAAVVVEPLDRHSVRIDALRRGRLDDVAHGVEHTQRIGDHLADLVGRRRGGGEPPGQEAHAGLGRRGVPRGVGAAHVERAEEVRSEEAALDAVAGLGEDPLDERRDMQEGVVVVRREEPLVGQQVGRAGRPGVFVAVDGEEAHGGRGRPAAADLRGREQRRVVDAQRVEHPQRSVRCPAGPAVSDLQLVALVRSRQQADPAAEELGAALREAGLVRRVVEFREGVQLAGKARRLVVAGRRGDRDLPLAPVAAGLDVGRLRRIPGRKEQPLCTQITGFVVDRQFHVMAVFCRSRISISRQQRFPRRRTTASSVATSIGMHSCSPTTHTSGDSTSSASAVSTASVS